MASNLFLFLDKVTGKVKEMLALETSAGAGDANKIVQTDATGKLDISLMPTGVDAEVVVAASGENLTAGHFVNLYNDGGVTKARRADATDNAKPAHGFVKANVTAPANATVFILGVVNANRSGLTVGNRYFLNTTAGGVTDDVSAFASGAIVQELGYAISATELLTFNNQNYIEIA